MIGYKGSHLDNTPGNTPKGFYRRARNILMKRLAEATSNEDGFSIDFNFGNKVVVAKKQVPGVGVLVFLKDVDYFLAPGPNYYNEIGWYVPSNKSYVRVLRAVFPLAPENTIKIEVEFNNDGDVIAIWNDKDSSPKILNLSRLPFEVDSDKIPLQPEQVRILNLFPTSSPIAITERYGKNIQGRVPFGTYSFLFSYQIDAELDTVPSQVEGSFKIGKYFTIDGGDFLEYVGTQVSNQGIKFKIGNVDTLYKRLNVYALQDLNGNKRAYRVRSMVITGSTMEVIFNGTFEEEVPYSELVVPTTIFDTAEAMTLLGGSVLFGGINKIVDIDYQKYANSITVEWALANDTIFEDSVLKPHKENIYNAPLHSPNFKEASINYHGLVGSFAPESTYQLFIQVIFGNGATSIPFNLPGMNHLTTEQLEAIDAAAEQPIVQSGTDPAPASSYLGMKNRHIFDFSSADPASAGGKMGYSRNDAESYPDTDDFDIWDLSGFTGKTLRNKPVRHHKMPGIKRITDKAIALGILPASPAAMNPADGADYSLFGRTNIALNLKNIPITQELISKGAVGFRVLYAERQMEDMDIVAFVPAFDFRFWEITPPETVPGVGKVNTLVGYDYTLLLKKPSLTIFTKTEFYNDQPQDAITTSPTSPGISGLAQVAYIPENTIGSDIDNRGQTASFYLRGQQPFGGVNSGRIPSNNDNPRYLMSDTYRYTRWLGVDASYEINFATQIYKVGREIPMISLRQVLNGHYVGLFSPKRLVDCSGIIPINSQVPLYIQNSRVFGGDFVRTNNSFRFAHRRGNNSRSLTIKKIFEGEANHPIFTNPHYMGDFAYPTYARLAAEFRYEKQVLRWQTPGLLVWEGEEGNNFSYSPSFELLNKEKTPLVVDPAFQEDAIQPFTILQSQTRGQTNSVSNWRRFLGVDAYIMQRRRGKIVNLQGVDDKLIIHMERGLFRTRGLITIPTNEQEAAIGTGRLFEFDPQELFPMGEGYGGTQHLSACFAFKLGYFFIDNMSGKAFLIGDEIREISSNGFRNFFMEEMRIKWAEQMKALGLPYDLRLLDSPLHPFGVGYLVGFDERNNRLLVTKRDFSLEDDVELYQAFEEPTIPAEPTPPPANEPDPIFVPPIEEILPDEEGEEEGEPEPPEESGDPEENEED
jgi:hypothetical protein